MLAMQARNMTANDCHFRAAERAKWQQFLAKPWHEDEMTTCRSIFAELLQIIVGNREIAKGEFSSQ